LGYVGVGIAMKTYIITYRFKSCILKAKSAFDAIARARELLNLDDSILLSDIKIKVE
jgi:hypothetical protein